MLEDRLAALAGLCQAEWARVGLREPERVRHARLGRDVGLCRPCGQCRIRLRHQPDGGPRCGSARNGDTDGLPSRARTTRAESDDCCGRCSAAQGQSHQGGIGMSVTTVTITSDLWRMSATELAQAIRSKQISCLEVIEAHLRRVAEVNPDVNAVTVVLAEQALEAAKAADRKVADGGDLPPLHGVPFLVKSNIDLLGTAT